MVGMNADPEGLLLTCGAVRDLTDLQLRTLCALYDRVWPPSGETLVERREAARADWGGEARQFAALWSGDALRAVAMWFPRIVRTANGPQRVQALAGVCSDPEVRGRGLGRRVVRAAFGAVDRGEYAVALFQTPVPEFYAKLGARPVVNGFRNSRFKAGDRGTAERPWWDPHVMIYPAGFPWPEGPIDLLGPGY